MPPGQTLLILTALNTANNYFPLLASDACAMLAGTARSCVESCDILQLVGLPCGPAGPNKNIGTPTEQVSKGLGTGGLAGIAILVVIFVIAVLVGAIFYYRRKYKVAKVIRSISAKLQLGTQSSSRSSFPPFIRALRRNFFCPPTEDLEF